MPEDYTHWTAEHIENYLQSLPPMKANSINTNLATIKGFCRWCEETHLLHNPSKKVKFLKRQPWQQRVLTEEELQKLLAVAKPDIAAVLIFLSHSGLRINELRSLKPESISPDKRLLYVIGKAGKARNVPLNKTALRHLPRVLKFSKNGHHYYNIFCRLAHKVGIEKFGAHALRHLYASRMAKHCNLYLLSRALGHKSIITTTEIYCHITEAEMQGLSDCLDRPAKAND